LSENLLSTLQDFVYLRVPLQGWKRTHTKVAGRCRNSNAITTPPCKRVCQTFLVVKVMLYLLELSRRTGRPAS